MRRLKVFSAVCAVALQASASLTLHCYHLLSCISVRIATSLHHQQRFNNCSAAGSVAEHTPLLSQLLPAHVKQSVFCLCRLAVLPAKGVPLQVKAVTGIAWLTTLLVCCVVPIDIYSTLSSRNPEALDILWDLSYWSTQLLTWALIPVYMGYADAGEFSWRGKMMASVKFNALFFVIMVRPFSHYLPTAARTMHCISTFLPHCAHARRSISAL